jgi:hypothetical protein
MQKIFNLMALFSFLVSGASVAGAWYLYKNADVMIEQAREKAVEEIAEAIPGIVAELMPAMPEVPEVPSMTGGVSAGSTPQLPAATGLPF